MMKIFPLWSISSCQNTVNMKWNRNVQKCTLSGTGCNTPPKKKKITSSDFRIDFAVCTEGQRLLLTQVAIKRIIR